MTCEACHGKDSEFFCTAVDRVRGLAEPRWRIERCKTCGFGWTLPFASAEEIVSFYPPEYLGNTEKSLQEFLAGKLVHTRSWRSVTEKVQLLEHVVRGGRILDVGCGDGKFLWALDPSKWDSTGVDFSGATLSMVRAHLPALHLIAGGIDSPLLPEGAFDVLTLWHVLEHLRHPADILARISALLRPGGWVIVSLPRFDSLQARIFRRYWYGFDDVPRHLYHFSRRSLDLLLREAGLEVRRHLFFSRTVSFHSLKHSLINWSEDRHGSRIPYYLLKPELLLFPMLERLSGKYGMLTTVARKPG